MCAVKLGRLAVAGGGGPPPGVSTYHCGLGGLMATDRPSRSHTNYQSSLSQGGEVVECRMEESHFHHAFIYSVFVFTQCTVQYPLYFKQFHSASTYSSIFVFVFRGRVHGGGGKREGRRGQDTATEMVRSKREGHCTQL